MRIIAAIIALTTPVLLQAQNVGIGTSTPADKLHVYHPSVNAVIRVQAGNALDFEGLRLMSDYGQTELIKSNSGRAGTFAGFPVAGITTLNAYGGRLVMGTGLADPMHLMTDLQPRLTITADGRVGIGTTAPTSAFHVSGAANTYFTIAATTATSFEGIWLTGDGGDTYISRNNTLRNTTIAGIDANNMTAINTTFGGIVLGTLSSATVDFITANTPRMHLTGDGNIGINTRTPTHKLHLRSETMGVLFEHTATNNQNPVLQLNANGNGIALHLNSGYLKVSGTNPTAFVHTAGSGNTSGNVSILSYANAQGSDMVVVTPNYNPGGITAGYNNHPIGVYWTGSAWSIFNQDLAPIPIGTAYNVLVIKQ